MQYLRFYGYLVGLSIYARNKGKENFRPKRKKRKEDFRAK